MRTPILTLGLVALAASAHAELAWDGVVPIPAYAVPGAVNSYMVCSPGFQLRYNSDLTRQLDKTACVAGAVSVAARAPSRMSLQDALETHFRAPAGWRAIAQGPLPVYSGNSWQGSDQRALGVAYKLVQVSPR